MRRRQFRKSVLYAPCQCGRAPATYRTERLPETGLRLGLVAAMKSRSVQSGLRRRAHRSCNRSPLSSSSSVHAAIEAPPRRRNGSQSPPWGAVRSHQAGMPTSSLTRKESFSRNRFVEKTPLLSSSVGPPFQARSDAERSQRRGRRIDSGPFVRGKLPTRRSRSHRWPPRRRKARWPLRRDYVE